MASLIHSSVAQGASDAYSPDAGLTRGSADGDGHQVPLQEQQQAVYNELCSMLINAPSMVQRMLDPQVRAPVRLLLGHERTQTTCVCHDACTCMLPDPFMQCSTFPPLQKLCTAAQPGPSLCGNRPSFITQPNPLALPCPARRAATA